MTTPYREAAPRDPPDAPAVSPTVMLGIVLRTAILSLIAFCPDVGARQRTIASCIVAVLSFVYGALELRALHKLRLKREGIVVATPWKTTWTPWSRVERIRVRWGWSGRVFELVPSSDAPIRIPTGCYASPSALLDAFRRRIPRLFEGEDLRGIHPPLEDGTYRLGRRRGADLIGVLASIPLLAVIPAFGFHELRTPGERVFVVAVTIIAATLVARREYHLRTKSAFTTQAVRHVGFFVGPWIPWSDIDSISERDGTRIVLTFERRFISVDTPPLCDLGEIEAIVRTHAPSLQRSQLGPWPVHFHFSRHVPRPD